MRGLLVWAGEEAARPDMEQRIRAAGAEPLGASGPSPGRDALVAAWRPGGTARSLDGRLVVALDGELYNAPALAALLKRAADGDAATMVLAAYQRWGRDALKRLEGRYACAILDAAAARLILARDHFGLAPLFTATVPGGLTAASTLPDLLALTGLPPRADPAAVFDYLDRGVTDHGAATVFAGVRSLPPAHVLDLALPDGSVRAARPYWTLATAFPPAADVAAQLRAMLLASVAARTDERSVALLSGGTDTSALVCAMRRARGTAVPVRTFSYRGGDGAASEGEWIDVVNAAAGADGHAVAVTVDDWAADLDAVVRAQAAPFGSPAVVIQHRLLAAAAAAGAGSVLAGTGGDELFRGPRWARVAEEWRRGHWRSAAALATGIQRTHPDEPGILGTMGRAGALAANGAILGRSASAAAARTRPWIARRWRRAHGFRAIVPWLVEPGDGTVLRALRARAVQETLPSALRFEDRSARILGLSIRLPLLTPAIAELALSLPDAAIVAADGSGKVALRAALRGLVPDAILDRRDKIGFAVPLHAWLRHPTALALLDAASRLPPVNGGTVAPWLATLRRGERLSRRTAFIAWRLIGLAAWVGQFGVALE